jgi:hypothetical protein
MQNQYDSYASNNFKTDLNFCDTVYIGNTNYEFGMTQSTNKFICNNLICSKCDNKVSAYKNQKWNDTCDYMFFRNNHGDQIRLSEVFIS